MNGIIKKYLPYAIIIFAVFILVPLLFMKGSLLEKYSPVAFYFILLTTAVITSAFYCAKHGIDFLFTLMAPIAFLFTMIYSGGFRPTNLILLFVYLIAGIFGQFLGDLAFGDERRKKEKHEQAEQEKLMLRAKRRDERERRRMEMESQEESVAERYDVDYDDDYDTDYHDHGDSAADSAADSVADSVADSAEADAPRTTSIDDDDFDYDKYMADIDRMLDEDRNRPSAF